VNFFSLLYRLKSVDRYLIWISNERDSVAVDNGGRVLTFESTAALGRYAELNHIRLESETPALHDLDWVALWTESPDRPVDCKEALAAWNIFSDIATSVGATGLTFSRLDSEQGTIYQKLFWGNNPPSLTPEGCEFVPEWSPGEIEELTKVLRTGLRMFEAAVG
jgi:hypothetical protein